MLLINCEINLILTWAKNCVISNATANRNTTYSINDSKLYIPLVTLSTQDDAKLSQKLKSGSNAQLTGININQNNTQNTANQYFDYLISPSF